MDNCQTEDEGNHCGCLVIFQARDFVAEISTFTPLTIQRPGFNESVEPNRAVPPYHFPTDSEVEESDNVEQIEGHDRHPTASSATVLERAWIGDAE